MNDREAAREILAVVKELTAGVSNPKRSFRWQRERNSESAGVVHLEWRFSDSLSNTLPEYVSSISGGVFQVARYVNSDMSVLGKMGAVNGGMDEVMVDMKDFGYLVLATIRIKADIESAVEKVKSLGFKE